MVSSATSSVNPWDLGAAVLLAGLVVWFLWHHAWAFARFVLWLFLGFVLFVFVVSAYVFTQATLATVVLGILAALGWLVAAALLSDWGWPPIRRVPRFSGRPLKPAPPWAPGCGPRAVEERPDEFEEYPNLREV